MNMVKWKTILKGKCFYILVSIHGGAGGGGMLSKSKTNCLQNKKP